MQIRLPLDVGTEMICKRRWDGAQHLAKIIERRKQEHTEEYEYYVHYKNCESWSAPLVLHSLGMANEVLKTQAVGASQAHYKTARSAPLHPEPQCPSVKPTQGHPFSL